MSLKEIQKRKGFTLIELMIVVAIIGILAAVAIPKFADLVTKSKEASLKGSLGAVRSALSIYYGDMEGEYPENLYTGLTDGSRYMSQSGGLGNINIPKTKTGNGGHNRGVVRESQVLQKASTALTGNDSTAFMYASNGTRWGEIFINCTHNDTKSTIWTAY